MEEEKKMIKVNHRRWGKKIIAVMEKKNLLYPSEKAMAPHSRTLAWKIPWTEEPGRLQSMGL